MTALYLLTANGIAVQEPLGLFSTHEHADAARRRLEPSNDGWHALAITELAVDEWCEPDTIGELLVRVPRRSGDDNVYLPPPAADERPWIV